MKAVKAGKIGKAKENGDDDSTTPSAAPSSTVASPAQAPAGTPPAAGTKRGSPAPQETGPSPSKVARTQAKTKTKTQTRGNATTAPTSSGLGSPAAAFPAFPSPVSSPRLRRSSSSSVSWSAMLTQLLPPSRVGRSPRAQDAAVEKHAPEGQLSAKTKAVTVEAEDAAGRGPEARSVGASSGGGGGGGQHGGKKAAERAGELTVAIPPISAAGVGHLRSPSEIMLDDIAESLADTTRKPSFARMQSVQVTFTTYWWLVYLLAPFC